ncbi:Septin-domain-containing protein [Circinella umbellata]|nr:Septin-domain-containing protein [Circinella umbellata]
MSDSSSKVFVHAAEASDRWSDSSPNSSGAATWSMAAADSNNELIVPRMNLDHDDLSHNSIDNNKNNNNNINNDHHSTIYNIGHLCIMVCGDSGIGKTRLVQAFTNMSEMTVGETEDILLDDFTIQETRVSMNNDDQQQKSICFVDTPGYGACVDAESIISSVTHYIERQFQQTNMMLNPMHPNTSKLTRLVQNTHGAHTHIDACLYIILDRLKRVDIEYMRALQPLCNLIPIILTNDHSNRHNQNNSNNNTKAPSSFIQLEFQENNIEPFDLFYPLTDIDTIVTWFCDRILFSSHRLQLLRQSTAQKFVTWRASQHSVMMQHKQQHHQDLSNVMTMTTMMEDSIEDEVEDDTLLLSTTTALTNAETVDRIHALRARHTQNMNLYISRYVSEKRKTMEREMFERERALKQELASVGRRKRIELILAELNTLFQQGSLEDVVLFDSTSPASSSSSTTKTATATIMTKQYQQQQQQQQQQKQQQELYSFQLLSLLRTLNKMSLIVIGTTLLITIHLSFDVYQWWTTHTN